MEKVDLLCAKRSVCSSEVFISSGGLCAPGPLGDRRTGEPGHHPHPLTQTPASRMWNGPPGLQVPRSLQSLLLPAASAKRGSVIEFTLFHLENQNRNNISALNLIHKINFNKFIWCVLKRGEKSTQLFYKCLDKSVFMKAIAKLQRLVIKFKIPSLFKISLNGWIGQRLWQPTESCMRRSMTVLLMATSAPIWFEKSAN